MVTLADALTERVRSAACEAGGNVNTAWNWLARASGSSLAVNASNRSRAGLSLLCNDPPVGQPPPPFPGGQCVGPIYNISYAIAASGSNFGPQRSPSSGFDTASGPGPVSAFSQNISGTIFTGFRFANGNTGTRGIGGNPTGITYLINTFVRADGQPDNCGNLPPPEPTGAPPPPSVTNITYNNDEGTEITIPVGLVFAPVFVDVNLDIRVPFTLEISPDITFRGDINLGRGGGGGPAPITFRPSGVPDLPDLDVELPEPPESVRCVAGVTVRLVVASGARATQLGRAPGPILHVPRIATIFFWRESGGVRSYSPGIDVKTTHAQIDAPCCNCWKGWVIGLEPDVALLRSRAIYKFI